MILFYDKTTGHIHSTVIGQDDTWTDELLAEWTKAHEGEEAVKIEDSKIINKHYDEDSGTLKDSATFSITVSKERVQSNDSDYIDFSGIPEGSKVSVDRGDDATMDASGVFRLTCTDPGAYEIRVRKHGYNWYYKEVIAYDNI